MALIYRIKEVKSINIFNHFKRFYFQNHSPRLITNHKNSKSFFDHNNKNTFFQFTNTPKNQFFRDSRVRFFAAPVQFVKKKEEVKLKRPRLNDEITAGIVRLVTDEGHDVVSLREAFKRANELKFDLVEVDSKSDPPVCRLMDYKKELYNKKMWGKERAKSKAAESLKSASKEVRLSLKAELKDIKIKADTVKRLMERGYRVKCSALASSKGRDSGGRDLNELLSTMRSMLGDVAVMEVEPKVDEKQGYMIVRHIKFGQCKKGNKVSKGLSPTNSNTEPESSACSDGNADYDEEDSESDLDDEVRTPLQSQITKSPPSQAPNVKPIPQPENRYAKQVPSNASPNIGNQPQQQPENRYAKKAPINASPNIGNQPQLQPENRYAKKVPVNASPNIGSQPQPQSQPENRYAKKVPNNPLRTRNIERQPRPQTQPQPRVDTQDRARQSGNNFSPHVDRPRPPSFTGNNASKSTSFGVFSGGKTDNTGPGVHVNQQVAGKPNSQASMNSPAGDVKKWGIFSGGK